MNKPKWILMLPKRYGKVAFSEEGAAQIAAKACIDVFGARGKVVRSKPRGSESRLIAQSVHDRGVVDGGI